ncbi:hypothetical protein LINPERPRIM_LOCUS20471, partial [Linum perenne]
QNGNFVTGKIEFCRRRACDKAQTLSQAAPATKLDFACDKISRDKQLFIAGSVCDKVCRRQPFVAGGL